MVRLRERDAVDRRHRIDGIRRAAGELRLEVGFRGEPGHALGVERHRADDDRVLGEVVPERARADARRPQQLRRSERVGRHDHEVGGDERGLLRAEVLHRDAGHPAILRLDPADEGEVAQLEARVLRSARHGEGSEDDVRTRPPHRAVGLRVARDRQRARPEAIRKIALVLLREEGPDGGADARVGERRTLHVEQALRHLDQLVPLVVRDEWDLLAERRRGRRARPVRAHPAHVGRGRGGRERRGVARPLAAEVDEVRALARREHALHDGRLGDAQRRPQRPRLRALRELAGALLLGRVRDVAHALAREGRELRSGLEHDDPRGGRALQDEPGVCGTDGSAPDDGDGGMLRHGYSSMGLRVRRVGVRRRSVRWREPARGRRRAGRGAGAARRRCRSRTPRRARGRSA